MSTEIAEWLHLALRFIHVVAAIMWIGSSIFFMWLDRHLLPPETDEEKDAVAGEIWMIHGGGIFHSRKRILGPGEIPEPLHWFKWEAYTTWLSGFGLLVLLYFLQSGWGTLIGLITLGGGWLIYDFLWRSPLAERQLLGAGISFVLVAGCSFALDQLLGGKSAFLHVGAMLGTMMAGNVFVHIIPNQKRMMAALKNGKPHDTRLGDRAKLRSTHNNYLTFPVLLLMLSAHFPQLWSTDRAWIILCVLVLALGLIKHWMNVKPAFREWAVPGLVTFLAAAVLVTLLQAPAKVAVEGTPEERGKAIFTRLGCAACHQAGPVQQGPSLVRIFGKPQPLQDGSSVVADEAYLRESILEPHRKIVRGYQPIMPPYGGVVGGEELDWLIAYIRNLRE